jgi:hypothetical protein
VVASTLGQNQTYDGYPMDFGTTPVAETLPSANEFVLKVFVEPVNGVGNSSTATGHSHR